MSATATTRRWSGAVGTLWSNPANWDSGVPANGDDLVFPGNSGFMSSNDLPPGLAIHSITIANGGRIEGNAIIVGAGGINMMSRQFSSVMYTTMKLPLTIDASQTWAAAPLSQPLYLGPVNLNGKPLTFVSGRFGLDSISGSGAIVVKGAAASIGPSTLSGPINVAAGDLFLEGVSARDATIDSDGTLETAAPSSIGNLTFNAAGGAPAHFVSASPLKVAGAVNLGNATVQVINPIGSSVTLIDNDGTDPVVGTFLGVPEGSAVNTAYRISYVGGSGNDVTLARLAMPVALTETRVTSSANPSAPGQTVTFTATVWSFFETPTGSVSFYDGATLIATTPVNSAGQATFSTAFAGGSRVITAAYTGAPRFAVSQGTVQQGGRRSRPVHSTTFSSKSSFSVVQPASVASPLELARF